MGEMEGAEVGLGDGGVPVIGPRPRGGRRCGETRRGPPPGHGHRGQRRAERWRVRQGGVEDEGQ